MFIGHLPAGYVLSRAFSDRRAQAAVLIGSVLPDADLLYFYTLSDRAVVHHEYWTHIPAFWLLVCGVTWIALQLTGSAYRIYVAPLLVGILLHLCLDSIAGSVLWFAPFSEAKVTLVHVPALYSPWVLNFIFHWTFLLELAVIVTAGLVYARRFLVRT